MKRQRSSSNGATNLIKRTKHSTPQSSSDDVVATMQPPASITPSTSLGHVAYLAAHDIVIHEENMPQPIPVLRNAPFPPPLVRVLCEQGFTTASPVQAATWPIATMGRDVLAIAKTGSGKTLGFLLPVLSRCYTEKRNGRHTSSSAGACAPLALIMAPTRELALQIHSQAEKFGQCLQVRSVALYGGAPKKKQIKKLQRGADVIVGTPGRIKDILSMDRSPVINVNTMCMLVLDEADRMLDMGFERDIRNIAWLAFQDRTKQTFFYSATWPLAVQDVAAALLCNPVKITVGKGGNRLTASTSVEQRVHVVAASQRMPKFMELMQPFKRNQPQFQRRVLVFANMKVTVRRLAKWCNANGLVCEIMSGERSQAQRVATIKRFREGTVYIVIATDVASRGLDIKGIQHVINYELPRDNFMDYVHRIGRTGRAGATGVADSLFTEGDRVNSTSLIKLMKDAKQVIPAALAKYAPTRKTFDSSSEEEEEE